MDQQTKSWLAGCGCGCGCLGGTLLGVTGIVMLVSWAMWEADMQRSLSGGPSIAIGAGAGLLLGVPLGLLVLFVVKKRVAGSGGASGDEGPAPRDDAGGGWGEEDAAPPEDGVE